MNYCTLVCDLIHFLTKEKVCTVIMSWRGSLIGVQANNCNLSQLSYFCLSFFSLFPFSSNSTPHHLHEACALETRTRSNFKENNPGRFPAKTPYSLAADYFLKDSDRFPKTQDAATCRSSYWSTAGQILIPFQRSPLYQFNFAPGQKG